jgi:predicted amidohydrolase YtcJ
MSEPFRSRLRVGGWGAALLLAIAGPARAQGEKADLVLTSAVVHTLDAQRPRAEAVAVRGNRIVGVGNNADVQPLIGPRTRVLDLRGQTVIPAFQESHGHLLNIGHAKMIVDLVGARSYQDVIDRVAAAVRTRKPGEWVTGRGWHEGKWTDTASLTVRGFPTHHALSAVSPANPVYLTRADGHAGFANARAMALVGITRDTMPPEGGEIIKDAKGEPTGVFVDQAQALVKVPRPTPEQQRQALDLALTECLGKGIAAFADAGVELEDVALYKDFAAAGRLGPRLYVMLRGLENVRRFGKPEIGLGGGFLTIRAVKLVSDGALGSRGAALLEPYVDDPGNSGFFTTPPETVLETARHCLAHGFQLCVHAIGDRANRMVLDTFEKAFREFPQAADPRFRVEHAQILDEADIPRFARLRVIASMQGIHATSDRPWAIHRLGPVRIAEGAYVWRKLLDSGAMIVNGTDAPVEDVDPIRCFYASVTRQDEHGQPPGGFDPDQRMTREEALRSYTRDAAYASFEEQARGSIAVGKLADLTVLSRDIMSVPDVEILGTQVVLTIVDGRVRYQREPERSPATDAGRRGHAGARRKLGPKVRSGRAPDRPASP